MGLPAGSLDTSRTSQSLKDARHDLALAQELSRGHGSPLTAYVCITRHETSALCEEWVGTPKG